MVSPRRAGAALLVSSGQITCSRFPVGSEALMQPRVRRPQGDGYSHLPTGGTGDGLGGNGSGGAGDGGGFGGDGVVSIGAQLENRFYCIGLP